MRKSYIRTIVAFISLALVFCLFPSNKSSAETVASGKCGDDLTWTIESNNSTPYYVLKISGSGDMYDYYENTAPWSEYNYRIVQVDLSGNITSIGSYAFSIVTNGFTSISIPNTVKTIGNGAFINCYNLQRITIPNSVTTIGQRAFEQCWGLSQVDYVGVSEEWNKISIGSSNDLLLRITPNYVGNLVTLDENIINGTATLSATRAASGDEITITVTPDEGYMLDTIRVNGKAITGTSFIMGNEDVTVNVSFKVKVEYKITVNDPEHGSVAISQDKAFPGDVIKVVVGPEEGYVVNSILVNGKAIIGTSFVMAEENATVSATFKKWYEITVEKTPNGSVTVSNMKAFTGDVIDVSVTPDDGYVLDAIKVNGVSIKGTTFSIGEEDVVVTATFIKPEYFINLKVKTTHGTATVSKKEAFAGDKITVSVTPDEGYGSSVLANQKPVSNNEFVMPAEDVELTVQFYPITNSGVCGSITWTLDEFGVLTISGSGKMIISEPNWRNYRDKVRYIVFNGNITSICDNAFDHLTNLISVNIPESVTSIGRNAFQSCEKLSSIVIPANVSSIGSYAFESCAGLKDVRILGKNTAIGGSAFEFCGGLTSVEINGGSIGKNAFVHSSLTSLKISKYVTSIGDYAFADCNLSSVTIDEGLSSIGSMAFMECNKLKSIILPYSVTSIGANAFQGCTSLTSVVLNKSAYSSGAFSNISTNYLHFYYDVNISSDGHGSIGGSTSGKRRSYGTDSFKLNVIPDKGYEIDKVTLSFDENTTAIIPNEYGDCEFIMPDSDTDGAINVTFNKSEHTILVSETVNGTAVVSKNTANYGDEITVTATPAEGYELYEIKVNGKTITGTTFNVGGSDVIVTVTFKKYTISVSETVNGTVTLSKNMANAGDEITITATPDTGYELDEIKVNDVAITGTSFTMGEGDATVTVTFKKSIYTITVSETSNGTVTVSKNTASIGDEIAITVTPDDGYELDEIKINDTAITGTTFNIGGSDVIVTVTFKKIEYAINVSETVNGTVTLSKNKASAGAEITITATPDTGYELDEIKVNDVAITGTTFTMVEGTATVTVTFKKSIYTITVSETSNGTVTVSKDTASIGDEISITVTPDDGYGLYEIKINGTAITGTTFIMGDGEATVSVSFKKIVASGTCGDNLTWTFFEDDTLTISGSGEMSYLSSEAPWKDYKANISSVVFNGNITSIGKHAFDGCENLTSITIPNSITSIGNCAFQNCSSITSITIPNGVTSIGLAVFGNCTSLTSITIPDSVTSIGTSAFGGCKNLTSITIPNSVTSIGPKAFYACGLTSITIPNSVTSFGSEAFRGCAKLTSITIPNSVTSIGEYAFYECSSLTSVTIPNSVTSIGEGAFQACGLTSITIPNSVTSFGSEAFRGCTKLTSITIQNGVTSIGERAFQNCSNLTSVTLPNSVTSISYGAFSLCSSLTSITIPNSVTSIGDYVFGECTSLTNITIPNSVTSIGSDAFWNCSSLTSITIPDSVTSIGSDAFYACGLTSITIPNSVTSISYGAFFSCSSLTSITIPNSVTSIGSHAFDDCNNLKDVYYSGTKTDWKNIKINSYNDELTHADIHYECVLINATIYYKCGDNQYYTFADGTLTIIGSGGMSNWTSSTTVPWKDYTANISSVVFTGDITSIGNYAFSNCSNLTSITIPDSVTSIGECAFYKCTKLTSITIPNSVTSIGSYAFNACSNLTSITIPNSVTSIGSCAFYNCTGLKDIYYGGSETDWNKISIGLDNTPLVNANIHYAFFEITVSNTVNGTVTVSKNLASVGDEITVTATPDDGYVLDSIKVNDVAIEGNKFTMGEEKAIVTVTFKKIEYTITVSETSNGSVIVSMDKASAGDEITITATPETGYELDEIKVNGTAITGNKFTMEAGNVIVSVTFKKKSVYTITVEATTNGTVEVDKSTAYVGDEITITATPETGYELDEIKVNGTAITGNKYTMEAGNITVAVTFKKVEYTVTVSESANGTASVNKTKAYIGDEITITATPETGYDLDEIKVNGTAISGNKYTMEAGNVTVAVTFKKVEYTVTVSESANGTASVDKATACIGDEITITATPATGYELDEIKVNGTAITGDKFTMEAGNVTVAVTFKKKSVYTITVEATTNGTVSVDKTTAYVGDEITITATPETGYELDKIKVNGNEISGYSFKMFAKDTTVEVSFKKISYKITLSGVTNGKASVSKTTAGIGDEITVTTTPDACYELDVIKVNNEIINDNKFTMPADNVTVTVTFKAKAHQITAVDEKPATCEENGYEAHYKCTECHKLFSDAEGTKEISSPKVINKLGHSWDEGEVTKEPTCEEAGVKTFHCTHEGCTATKTESIKALGHSWDKGEVTKEPTCEEAGVKTFHCTRTGCSETKSEPIKALGHKVVVVTEKAPTKTEPGNIKHYKCERCGKLFSDANGKNEISQADTVIPAMGHDLTAVKAKAATCTEPGNTAYYICKDDDCKCGKAYSDPYGQHEINIEDTVIPALGHNPKEVAGKDPTCTEDGYEKYYKCSRCNTLFSDADGKNEIEKPVVIPKLGHDMKHIEAKKPTHDDDGHKEYYHCNRCGKNFADEDGKTALTDAELVVPRIGAAVLGEVITEGDFIYKVTNPRTDGTGTVTVIGVANRKAAVVIPATVELKLDIYKVNRIGTKAFYGNKTITSLSIGSNVVVIDSYAFYGCSKLVKVSGGKALKSIGTKAFAYCSKLKSFSITSSVLNKIGSYAFQKDKKLKTVYIRYTTKLTKSGVKKSLKKSYVKTVKVKKSKVKKYKKYFKKSNSGRKVKVKK